MSPGTILFDKEFLFSDGTRGQKLMIILNDGSSGNYIALKTTSNPNYKGNDYGCQSDDRYPNFFLPKGSCCLKEHTWIQLDQFFEFKAYEFISWHFSGRLNRIGVLPAECFIELLECAIDCYDVSVKQAEVLRETLRIMNSETPE